MIISKMVSLGKSMKRKMSGAAQLHTLQDELDFPHLDVVLGLVILFFDGQHCLVCLQHNVLVAAVVVNGGFALGASLHPHSSVLLLQPGLKAFCLNAVATVLQPHKPGREQQTLISIVKAGSMLTWHTNGQASAAALGVMHKFSLVHDFHKHIFIWEPQPVITFTWLVGHWHTSKWWLLHIYNMSSMCNMWLLSNATALPVRLATAEKHHYMPLQSQHWHQGENFAHHQVTASGLSVMQPQSYATVAGVSIFPCHVCCSVLFMEQWRPVGSHILATACHHEMVVTSLVWQLPEPSSVLDAVTTLLYHSTNTQDMHRTFSKIHNIRN